MKKNTFISFSFEFNWNQISLSNILDRWLNRFQFKHFQFKMVTTINLTPTEGQPGTIIEPSSSTSAEPSIKTKLLSI